MATLPEVREPHAFIISGQNLFLLMPHDLDEEPPSRLLFFLCGSLALLILWQIEVVEVF